MRISTLILALCVIVLAPSRAHSSQQHVSQALNVQQADTPGGKIATQRGYDPLAGQEHLGGGIWDNALGKINAGNKDYGECVSEWQHVAAAATLHSIVFWIAVAMSLGLVLSLLFIYWLLQDRGRRLHITVNILTQISNAYIDARDHALNAIEKHNQLADDYNALAEKLAALEHHRTENQRRVQRESEGATEEDAHAISGEPGTDVSIPRASDQARDRIETQVRQRFANQISALQEKNKSLRTSLNDALTRIEALKRQQAATRGV